MPTIAEIIARLEAVYASVTPRTGDVVNIVKGGRIAARAHITFTDPRVGATDSAEAVAFTISSVTYYANIETGGAAGRVLVVAFTMDTEAEPPQVVPTAIDLKTAIASLFDETNPPREGDAVLLTYSSKVKFRAQLTKTDLSALTVSDTSLFVLEMDLDLGGETPETWWATLTQTGLF